MEFFEKFSSFISKTHLASRHELQRSQGGLHVRDVGLEVVEGIGDAGFQLRGALS